MLGVANPTTPAPGGTGVLPAILSLQQLVTARADELRKLRRELADTRRGKNKRSFQLLSKWDRRRVQSHNPYRIPRKNRDGILREFEKGAPKGSKRKPKDRRRPQNILARYARRSSKNKWLDETHIWHAKRFHMKNLWGYRLAMKACEKQQRRMYRYASRSLLLHDRSYLATLELTGPSLSALQDVVQRFVPDVTSVFHTQLVSGGYRGFTHFFVPDTRSPPLLLAPVEFLWVPAELKNEDAVVSRRVWLLVHPSAAHQLFRSLKHIIHRLQPAYGLSLDVRQVETGCFFEVSGRRALQALCETLTLAAPPDAASRSETWKYIWNTLKPLSRQQPPVPDHAVLPLFISPPQVLGPFPARPRRLPPLKAGASSRILQKELIQWPHAALGQTAASFFDPSVRATSKLPPNAYKITFRSRKRKNVVALVAHLKSLQEKTGGSFGRCRRRLARSNAQRDSTSNPLLDNCDNNSKTLSTFSRHKPKLFDEQIAPSSVPILVIKRKTNIQQPGFYHGYDVLVPPHCGGRALWTLLTRQQCCTIGVNDRHHLMTDAGQPEFPFDYPETLAGRHYAFTFGREMLQKHLARPPSKRVNYAVLQTAYPFCANWEALLNIQTSSAGRPANETVYEPSLYMAMENPFFASCPEDTLQLVVLRPFCGWGCTVAALDQLSYTLDTPSDIETLSKARYTLLELLALLWNAMPLTQAVTFYNAKIRPRLRSSRVLLSVRVSAAQVGIPKTQSHLYTMTHGDMQRFRERSSCFDTSERENFSTPTALSAGSIFRATAAKDEPMRKIQAVDPQYKEARQRHLKKTGCSRLSLPKVDAFGQLGCYAHSNVDLCGFVTSGHHSLSSGKGQGIGCVTLLSFCDACIRWREVQETKRIEVSKAPYNPRSASATSFLSSGFKHWLQNFTIPFWFGTTTSLIRYVSWVTVQTA